MLETPPPPLAASSSTPSSVGRYRPLIKLGTGGMADVFLAVSRSQGGIEKLSVIKRLRPDLSEEPEEIEHFKGMFWDEARLAMLLNHTNVVHTHDACEEDGSLFLVMEYIEGHSLNSVQRELARQGRPLTAVQCALIAAEILAGLHYAHELKNLAGERLNIIHRDVSPQNILIGYDGAIKLVDFGVALAATRTTHTKAGMLKGKARYMAPEQVRNRGIDRRVDIYAMGVVLWELAARTKLVGGANMVEQLLNVLKVTPERLSTVVPGIDSEFEGIVHKALAREPNERYQTAQDMRDALLAFAKRSGEPHLSELGVLVTETFKKEREDLAALIRSRLVADAEKEARGLPAHSMPSLIILDGKSPHTERLSVGSIPAPRSAAISFTPPPVARVSDVPPPTTIGSTAPPPQNQPPQSQTVMFLVGTLMVVLLVAGGLAGVVVARGDGAPRAAAATALPPAAAELRAPPVVAAPVAPEPAKAPEKVVEKTPEKAPEKVVEKVVEKAPEPPRAVAIPRWIPPVRHTPPPAPTPTVSHSAPAPAVSAPQEEPGYLTIDTYPWTRVHEGSRFLGNTPIVRLPLSPGVHVLTLENSNDDVRQTTTVTIRPGETLSKRLGF